MAGTDEKSKLALFLQLLIVVAAFAAAAVVVGIIAVTVGLEFIGSALDVTPSP